MVEGVDFRLDWPGVTFRTIGRRLMSINLSDLAAMGAEPRHALISLCLPGRLAVADVTELYRGIAERARQYGCSIAGGDLSGTEGPLMLTAALYGTIAPGRRPLRRAGARAGWALAVTGRLGLASAGLGLLLDGKRPRNAAERRWVKALYDPQPRVEAARILQAMGLRVAGDISDGLYREIERIGQPAGLGATIEADQLPLDPDVRRSRERAWAGGLMESEDYELVCAAPRKLLEAAATRLRDRLELNFSIVGTMTRERGIRVRVDGRLVSIPSIGAGYDHFR
jgi:thiamine-monophosphate kinase